MKRVALVIAVIALGVSASFDTHPFIRCEACTAVAAVIGHKMNESAKIRSSYKSGHRLDPNNKVKMQDYESSELRAIEIMESACNELSDWRLHQDNEVRVIRKSKDASKNQPRFYGANDRSALDNFDKRLKNFCNLLLDEHDEAIVVSIRSRRFVDELTEDICVKSCGHCEPAVVRKGRMDEKKKWEKAEAKRRKEEEESDPVEAKSREKEDARKAEEEAEFLAPEPKETSPSQPSGSPAASDSAVAPNPEL